MYGQKFTLVPYDFGQNLVLCTKGFVRCTVLKKGASYDVRSKIPLRTQYDLGGYSLINDNFGQLCSMYGHYTCIYFSSVRVFHFLLRIFTKKINFPLKNGVQRTFCSGIWRTAYGLISHSAYGVQAYFGRRTAYEKGGLQPLVRYFDEQVIKFQNKKITILWYLLKK